MVSLVFVGIFSICDDMFPRFFLGFPLTFGHVSSFCDRFFLEGPTRPRIGGSTHESAVSGQSVKMGR